MIKRKVQSTTTKDAVAGFFTPASKKDPEKMAWRIVRGSLLVARFTGEKANAADGNTAKRRRIAGFDLVCHGVHDSTLIQTREGRRFGKDANDWRWWHAVVPGALKDLHEKGYQVIIFSNQAGISLRNDPKTVKGDMKRLKDFKDKVSSILHQLDFPTNVYAATAHDEFRKPRTGMWDEMMEECHLDVESVEFEGSFFVGDAGGRQGSDGFGKDHSCSDRNFASNIGITFHTPEEYFLQETPKPFKRDFDPTTFLNPTTRSTDANNTNADAEVRAKWVQVAQKRHVPIRCVYFTAPALLCQHNDAVRALNGTLVSKIVPMGHANYAFGFLEKMGESKSSLVRAG
ncbi:MAG: hypothetical protein M1832_000106 [Thelocarpon impressellum]|nr:MAG: hypothetical protein M1832_000106 [Thelocarpon impressellum]